MLADGPARPAYADEALRTDVRVQWPDGEIGEWSEVDADGFVELTRGGEPVAWSPPD